MKTYERVVLLPWLLFLALCFFPPLVSGASSIPDIESVIQTPIEPPPNTVVNVLSVVVDKNGLTNISLFYSTDSSSWASKTMMLIDGDNYNGTFLAPIPGQAADTRVSYYVYALDNFGFSTITQIKEYTVTEDGEEPWFVGIWMVHPRLRPITSWDVVKIRANITDDGSGVADATLFYGFNEPDSETIRALFSKASMSLTDGDKYDGAYEGEIPSQENNTIVWYYIETCDVVGNKRISDYSAYEVYFGNKSYLQVVVQISEIDTKDLSATLNIIFHARLPSPFEQESFWVHVYNAKGHMEIFKIDLSTSDRFWYENTVTWKTHLLGNPNCFPYDRYTLNLSFVIWWSEIDDMQITSVYYSDYRLHFVWEAPGILNRGANYTSKHPEVFADLQIVRNMDDRLPVILPILALFFMLGATLSVDSKTHLKSRLTVYLTSFVFIVGFFYTLDSWVPLRFGFTIAELMVVVLTIGTVTLVVSSFISVSLSERYAPAQVLISTCADIVASIVILVLCLFAFRVRHAQALILSIPSPDSFLIVIGIIYGLLIGMYLNRKHLKMELAHVHTQLRGFTRNFVRSLQGDKLQSSDKAAVPNQAAERLDRAFDLILLLVGIISAAILQYASTLGDLNFTTFSMRLVFIPVIPLILFWLWNQITNNLNLKIFIRIFVWFLGLFTLFNDIFFFLVLSFLKLATVPLALILSTPLYVLAFILDRRIETIYGYRRRDLKWIGIAAYLLAIAITVITFVVANLP